MKKFVAEYSHRPDDDPPYDVVFRPNDGMPYLRTIDRVFVRDERRVLVKIQLIPMEEVDV